LSVKDLIIVYPKWREVLGRCLCKKLNPVNKRKENNISLKCRLGEFDFDQDSPSSMTNSFILIVLFPELIRLFGGEIGLNLKSLCLQGFDPGEDTYQVSVIITGFVIGSGISL